MFNTLRVAASRSVRPSWSATRAFSSSPRVLSGGHGHDDHGHAPVIVTGTGAKPGEVATDENQSTGLERYQLMGQIKGVDVFDMQGILMTRQGTLKDPIIVPSFSKTKQIGCTGWPIDSHDTIWIASSVYRENSRCPECGNVYKLQLVDMENVDGVEAQQHDHAHSH